MKAEAPNTKCIRFFDFIKITPAILKIIKLITAANSGFDVKSGFINSGNLEIYLTLRSPNSKLLKLLSRLQKMNQSIILRTPSA